MKTKLTLLSCQDSRVASTLALELASNTARELLPTDPILCSGGS